MYDPVLKVANQSTYLIAYSEGDKAGLFATAPIGVAMRNLDLRTFKLQIAACTLCSDS